MASSPAMPPALVYGTAWKKARTATLVKSAIASGFRGIDSAAQPRHYSESLVGDGIRAAIDEGIVERKHLWIQTKFTWVSGQDLETLPYDVEASISEQVHQSVTGSLQALAPAGNEAEESYLDCVLLHFALPTLQQSLEAWTALERFVPHRVRTLGICNVNLSVLKVFGLAKSISVRPSVVQNRFHAATGYDTELRAYCLEHDMVYQAFGVLKSNLLGSEVVRDLAAEVGITIQAALYGLMLSLGGMSLLNGTTNVDTMKIDLDGVQRLHTWSEIQDSNPAWQNFKHRFHGVIAQQTSTVFMIIR